MTSNLSVYLAPRSELLAVPGSRDAALLKRIEQRQAGLIELADDHTREMVDDEIFPRFLSCLDAVRYVLNGEEIQSDLPWVYGRAYELICSETGAGRIGEWNSIANGAEWIEQLDEQLQQAGVDLIVSDLAFGGPLFEIPPPDDAPLMGSWSKAQIDSSVERLSKLASPLKRLFGPKIGADLADVIRDLARWTRQASQMNDGCLIGVYD